LEHENLGERLSGDRIENSLYKLEMKVPHACEIVCKKSLNKAQVPPSSLSPLEHQRQQCASF
jgi:hypothetical protein